MPFSPNEIFTMIRENGFEPLITVSKTAALPNLAILFFFTAVKKLRGCYLQKKNSGFF